MMGFALSALGILKRIPREVWLFLSVLAALWMWVNHRESQARADEREKIERKAHEQFVADAQALADLSLQYEQKVQSLRDAERADRESIRTIYRDKIVPAECAADPAVVGVLDNAVSRANAATTGQLGDALPKAP
jgi:flagellar biosynthesis component FlhA